ncbi:MAG TPA: DUF362 domain-containing protein [Verrucomicrobiae bacterium]|nr:DUF362 domain-containing protein [Verrucomicrobiae bacterium]
MSRNARKFEGECALSWIGCVGVLLMMQVALEARAGQAPERSGAAGSAKAPSRVVVVQDPLATDAFKPDADRVRQMTQRAIMTLTGRATPRAAWASLVSPKDVVGIKVYSAPGPDSGTRPAVVAAIVEGLLEAGLPGTNIIVWDRQRADLRRAGFMDLAERYGIRAEGSVNVGFDEQTFYAPDTPILGQLVYGEVEFGRSGEGVGRRSFVTKLLTQNITKLINVTPLLNHNSAGVTGHLYSLAFGSIDNVLRFENDLVKMSTAIPEIYALPSLSDRVVLNVTDGLICQYQGEHTPLLHYAVPLNELRFSKDPVALDALSLRELEKARVAAGAKPTVGIVLTNQFEVLQNAAMLLLGQCDSRRIQVERN